MRHPVHKKDFESFHSLSQMRLFVKNWHTLCNGHKKKCPHLIGPIQFFKYVSVVHKMKLEAVQSSMITTVLTTST